jgi:uncharacterized membrane protein YbjE (DUF340 family)
VKKYTIKIAVVTILFFAALFGLETMGETVGWYSYAGIIYLALLMLVLRYFSVQQAATENSWVRRTMVLSMLRMMLTIVFLAIILINAKIGNPNFSLQDYTVFALSYFVCALAFDILDFRSNLRPLSERHEENANH